MSSIARRCVALVALSAVLAVGGVQVHSAAASTLVPVSGTFAYGNPSINRAVGQDGDNTIIEITCPLSYTGTLRGTATIHGTLIVHGNSATFYEVETFTGMAHGTPGALTFTVDGTGRVGNPGAFLAHVAIVSGTGMLADYLGVIKEVGTIPLPAGNALGTYRGWILDAR